MRLIKSLGRGRKTRFGGTGQSFIQPNFWSYPSMISNGISGNREWIENDFTGYVQQIYKDNGAAYACVQTRALVFSEATFKFKRSKKDNMDDDPDRVEQGEEDSKKPGGKPKPKLADPKKPKDDKKDPDDNPDKPSSHDELFDDPELDILNHPWPGGFLGNLLFEMDVDASVAGNSYWTFCDDQGNYGNRAKGKPTTRLVRMRPDYVQLIIYSRSGDPWALDAKLGGYLYKPYKVSGATSKDEYAVLLMPDEVAHYAPIQDPEAHFRGMSWITPVLRELGADKSAMEHKKTFFDNGATLGHVVSLSEEVGPEDFQFFVEKFKEEHEGVQNAYKTLVLGGGADVVPVGADFKQLDFTQTQGHGETRIAAASGVPPVIVGLSEGLQAATYSNYGQARRRFADGTLRPLWRIVCGALSNLLDIPEGVKLWYDDQDIAFLRDDQVDEATISEIDSRAAKALIEAGYEPDTVTEYLVTRDASVLEHTGMVSVQLLPPGQLNPDGPMGGMGAGGGAGAEGEGTNGDNSNGGKPKPSASANKPSGGKYV